MNLLVTFLVQKKYFLFQYIIQMSQLLTVVLYSRKNIQIPAILQKESHLNPTYLSSKFYFMLRDQWLFCFCYNFIFWILIINPLAMIMLFTRENEHLNADPCSFPKVHVKTVFQISIFF